MCSSSGCSFGIEGSPGAGETVSICCFEVQWTGVRKLEPHPKKLFRHTIYMLDRVGPVHFCRDRLVCAVLGVADTKQIDHHACVARHELALEEVGRASTVQKASADDGLTVRFQRNRVLRNLPSESCQAKYSEHDRGLEAHRSSHNASISPETRRSARTAPRKISSSTFPNSFRPMNVPIVKPGREISRSRKSVAGSFCGRVRNRSTASTCMVVMNG